MSVFEIMTALTTGATVDVVRDVLELGERDDWQGTVVSSVPSVFAELLDRIAGKVRVGTLVFAGEPLPAALVRRARTAFPGVRVVNGYGQTETSTQPTPSGATRRRRTGPAPRSAPRWTGPR
ncbi:hypothetical protein STENM327S_07264 [Streptomyces tendae]